MQHYLHMSAAEQKRAVSLHHHGVGAAKCFGFPWMCENHVLLYLATSWGGYEDQLMLKLFEDTGCFVSANYCIQVYYS